MAKLEQVRPEFRASFQRFIDTGEADEAFLEYMDADEACQQAVDAALTRQAEDVRAFAEALREPEAAPATPDPREDRFEEVLRGIETVAASVGSAKDTDIEHAFEQHATELPLLASALEKLGRAATRVLRRRDELAEGEA